MTSPTSSARTKSPDVPNVITRPEDLPYILDVNVKALNRWLSELPVWDEARIPVYSESGVGLQKNRATIKILCQRLNAARWRSRPCLRRGYIKVFRPSSSFYPQTQQEDVSDEK